MKKGKVGSWIFGIFCLLLCFFGMPFSWGTIFMFLAGILALPISPIQNIMEIFGKGKKFLLLALFILAVALGIRADKKAENGEMQADLSSPTATMQAAEQADLPSPTPTVEAVTGATEEMDEQTAALLKTEKPTSTATTKPTSESNTAAATTRATAKATEKATVAPTEKVTPKPTAVPTERPTEKPTPVETERATEAPQEPMVWISGTGSRYHSHSSCSNMKSPTQIPLSEAQRRGYTPCKNCYH